MPEHTSPEESGFENAKDMAGLGSPEVVDSAAETARYAQTLQNVVETVDRYMKQDSVLQAVEDIENAVRGLGPREEEAERIRMAQLVILGRPELLPRDREALIYEISRRQAER
jgi:hypothetical protein